jgi:hypothetical protein
MQFVPFWYHTTFSGCKQHLSFFKYNSTVIKHDSWTMKATKWQIRPGIIRWMGPGQATNECKTSKHRNIIAPLCSAFVWAVVSVSTASHHGHCSVYAFDLTKCRCFKFKLKQNKQNPEPKEAIHLKFPAKSCFNLLQNWNGSDRLWETCQSKQQNNALSRGEKLL